MNYLILYYSNLQLTSYNAYISLEKTTNLFIKRIAWSHFLGSCGEEVLYHRGSPMLQKQISKLTSTETNAAIFHTPEN